MKVLEIKSLNTFYGESHILRDVDLTVKQSEMVCLIGRNGVGKTTLLKSLIGLLKPKKGEIVLNGNSIIRKEPHQRAKLGIAYVPQGREIIPYLTVEENLLMGLEALPGGLIKNKKIDETIYDLFPVLRDFLKRKGGDLSGGQQQQLAIARALASDPKLLLLDEPTEGIQPNIVEQIEECITRLNRELKLTIVLVEQNVDFARKAASHFAMIENGTCKVDGKIEALTAKIVSQYMTI